MRKVAPRSAALARRTRQTAHRLSGVARRTASDPAGRSIPKTQSSVRVGPLALGLALALLVRGPAAAADAPRLQSAVGGTVRALVVGIDDYARVTPKLQGSVGDARDIAAALRSDGVSDVDLLLDTDATRDAFLAGMRRLLDASEPGDLAVVTYSGHGASVPEYPQFAGLDADGRTEVFVMVDYDVTGSATGEVVANKEIEAWLSRFDAKGVDVLFVADSCFGGGMVRGIPDPRVGPPVLRVARDAAPQDAGAFRPMPMTAAELRVDVANLPHVTVLSGADRFTPVPEVFIPTPPTRRGALSYALARALGGNAAGPGSPVTTRRQLFSYARQEVQHYSDDQRIDQSPGRSTDDLASLERPVFQVSAAPVPPSPVDPDDCAVRMAVIPDAGGAKAGLASVGVPLALVDDPGASDVVWDVAAGQVIQTAGDVVADRIGPAEIAGVIERTSAVQCIKRLTEVRPQLLTLRDGIKRYTPRDRPTFEAFDVADRYLIVFDVAADGRIQVVWPERGRYRPMSLPSWTESPDVMAPFGADYAVAVSSAVGLDDFLGWLDAEDDRRPGAAMDAVSWLRRIQARDPTARVGAAALYTAAE